MSVPNEMTIPTLDDQNMTVPTIFSTNESVLV